MEGTEQITRFQEFIEDRYKKELLENVSNSKNFVVIDFMELSKFDPDLAEELLNDPEETIKACELAAEQIDLPVDVKKIRTRFVNLPPTHYAMIRDIRSNHIGRFLQIDGLVRQKSDVRPQVVSSRFECPSCGAIQSILQLDTALREPNKCACGRRGKFRVLSQELVDAQRMVLEEIPESLEGGEQPKRFNILLKEDLVSPITEKRTNPGSKVMIIGIIKEVPVQLKSGAKSTSFDLVIEANSVQAVEEDFYEIIVSEDEEKQIKQLASDPKVYDKLTRSLIHSIHGHDEVKEALLLQLFGGVHKKRTDGVQSRGDIHVLLVGDPGSGKSQMLKRISSIAPKGRYVSGKGVSGAGMTAAVVKDEFLGGWSLEAGALVLANNGVCCIDEMDKMGNDDRSAMHEALEQQSVSISKANIHATLLARTTVLAAANPKFGRFDPYGIIAEQIDLPPTLINRFDLIFPIKDLPEPKKDEQIATHILTLHQNPDIGEAEIPTLILKKYIAYARQHSHPVLSDEAIEEIREYYVQMRGQGQEEKGLRAIPISARQLEALVRLSEASAKIRLSEKVTRKDAERAIRLLTYCLMQVGFDKETGRIDIDRISTGIGASQRSKIFAIREIVQDLEAVHGKMIPSEDVIKAASEKGITENEAYEIIEKLKRQGDIYEPRRGFISRI